MKVKKEIFHFKQGKYVAGDISKVFEEKNIKKMKATFSRIKTKGGYNKKHDIHYFLGDSFVDYIDKGITLSTEIALTIIPEELSKSGKLMNCKRFTAKHNFTVTYIEDKLGSALYFRYPEEPSPFMMLVNEVEA